MSQAQAKEIHRLLFANQLWETVAFLAKAGFLVLLTPRMLQQWGASGYGQFALASSSFVLLSALLDCGLRPQLRLALCSAWAEHDLRSYRRKFCAALLALVCVLVTVILLAASLLSAFGYPISLALITLSLTGMVLISGLLVEPLAAQGEMALFKLAHAAGSLAAIVAGYLVLRFDKGVTVMVAAWLGCLITANLLLFLCSRLLREKLWLGFRDLKLAHLRDSFQQGAAFFAINATWLAKTHGLTLVVSQISGAAAAGFFFIFLRTSEVIGTLCAVASDAVIAALASYKTLSARRAAFAEACRQVAVLSSHASLLSVLLLPFVLPLWLGQTLEIKTSLLCAVAAFGLANAFNRIASGASMGLGQVTTATKCGLLEAVVSIVATAIAQRAGNLTLTFACATLGVLCLLPLARVISRELRLTNRETWLKPLTLPLLSCAILGALGLTLPVFAVCLLASASAIAQFWHRPNNAELPITSGLLVTE